MKSIEVRLVGRFRLCSRFPGNHEHLLYRASHTQNESTFFLKGEQARQKQQSGTTSISMGIQVQMQTSPLTILQEGKILQSMQGGIGIPHMQWCGQEEDYHFIVLEQLDHTLQTWLARCGGKFSFKTVLLLGIELIGILQYFHFKNFVHNFLHPRHIMTGQGANYAKLYLIDYASASRYRDSQTLEHIEEVARSDRRILNHHFSSIGYHRGRVSSRKDDMISFLYLLLYFLEGKLPWTHLTHRNPDDLSRAVLQAKEQAAPELIFRDYPDLLMLYRYTEQLAFDQKPRYSYYRNVFRQRLEREGFIQDGIYDWVLLPDPELQDLESDDFELNFDIVPNEQDFIRQISQEIKLKEKLQTEIQEKRKSQQKKTTKTEKQCALF